MRMPAVAGRFYEDSPELLITQIEDCYDHPLGPGERPKLNNKGPRSILGLVSPHAGYVFSGPIASWGFGALASDGFPEVFIIIGPNHTGIGERVSVSIQTYKMPLGPVEVDKTLARKLATVGPAKMDEKGHRFEHSVEVQLPFLQHLKRKIKFVPIVMREQDLKTSIALGDSIVKAAGKRDVVVVASSDMTHCGMQYGQHLPPGRNAGEYACDQDALALDNIKEMDPKGLITTVRKKGITMCGSGPVAAMMQAAKRWGATSSELLRYASSYDVMPGDSAVGYASAILRK